MNLKARVLKLRAMPSFSEQEIDDYKSSLGGGELVVCSEYPVRMQKVPRNARLLITSRYPEFLLSAANMDETRVLLQMALLDGDFGAVVMPGAIKIEILEDNKKSKLS